LLDVLIAEYPKWQGEYGYEEEDAKEYMSFMAWVAKKDLE
jgi:hypothetical protein